MHSTHLRNILSFILLLIASTSFAQEALNTDKAITINELSHEPYRRTFAMPLPLDNAQTLYFERDGTQAKIWRLDWRNNLATPSLLKDLPLSNNDKELRYTALQTRVGLWLIGPIVMLIKPNGDVVSLPAFGANEPTAVALPDGSVFVLGSNMHNHTESMRRLALTAQGISVEDKGELPNYLTGKNVNYKKRYGVAALTLADGRVFTAGGGGYSDDMKRAAIVDTQNGFLQLLPDMPHARTFAVLLTLKDGRIVVAGDNDDGALSCSNADERTVDIYIPQLNAWQSLPDLPFPLCAKAYHATGPTGTVLPNGTIVLGGHLEKHVMVLHPDSSSANGYAHFWEVVGPTDRMRISGVLQALSNSEVVIAGGVHHLDSNGCCYGTPGAERLKLIMNDQREQFAMSLHGSGVAQYGDRVFIASGRIFSVTLTGQLRYSTVAELLDLRTGRIQQLPSLPFVTGEAQVAWLDEDHVLVKGQFADRSNREFQPSERLSPYIKASSGALAIFNVSKQQWSKLFDTEQLKDTRLLDARGDEALFLNSKGDILQMRLSTQSLSVVTTPTEKHTDPTGRILADGRVVLVGGNMQRVRISLINDTCELAAANPRQDCPEQYVGWGPLLPAMRYQWYTPKVNDTPSLWQQSVNAPDAYVEHYSELVQTIIDAQGRVLRLVRTYVEGKSEPDFWLVRSDNGNNWQRLPMPNPDVCSQGCRLQLATDPRNRKVELLFLRDGEFDNVYFTERFNRDKYHTEKQNLSSVWWLDELSSPLQWRKVLQTDENSIIHEPQVLADPLSSIQSFGWNLAQPILWVSH